MKKRTATILKYTVVFEPAKEGGYVVSVPSLPGCMSQGDTFEEAEKMIKDAIKGYLAVLKDQGEEIPQQADDVVISTVSIPQSTI